MKVTVCFADTKVRVPCGTGDAKVSDIIKNAISRYKKATFKPAGTIVNVYKLKTNDDGGILDPDDILKDVIEDQEILIAVYDEYFNPDDLKFDNEYSNFNKNGQNNEFHNISDNDVCSINSDIGFNENECNLNELNKNELANCDIKDNSIKMRSGSESCINKIDQNEINTNITNRNNWTMPKNQKESNKLEKKCIENENNYFNRANLSRQSKVNNDNYIQFKNVIHNEGSPEHFTESEIYQKLKLININGPLGIHVIPTFDVTSQKDMGLIIQQIEPNGHIFKDGRFKTGDRIIEINSKSLIDVDFLSAQEILRDAMKDNEMLLTIIRDNTIFSTNPDDNYERHFINSSNYHNNDINKQLFIAHENQNYDERKLEIEYNKLSNIESLNNFNEKLNCNNIDDFDQNNVSPIFFQNTQKISNKINLSLSNTKKMGKKIQIQLIKGPQGLGFKLAARDNPTGEISPIYVKNILPKGAAVIDGRLQRGDRLIEVNGLDMTVKSLHEAVNILRNTKLGSLVDIVVSRQLNTLPRELSVNEQENQRTIENDLLIHRELLTFEIPLNDTGSAGLGVSVKGKTKKHEDYENCIDLGIFVKTVINGGAASKDGRLKSNDQLININGFSLLGKSNEEAMQILREAIQVETMPGHIQLTISRKKKQNSEDKIHNIENNLLDHKELIDFNLNKNIKDSLTDNNCENRYIKNRNNDFGYILSENHFIKNDKIFQRNGNHCSLNHEKRTFSRDAPTRRSMSEKRKQTSDIYNKVKINKINDKTNLVNDKELIRSGSYESLIGTAVSNKESSKNTASDDNKSNFQPIQNECIINEMKKNYSNLKESKTNENNVTSLDNIQYNKFINVFNSKKSNSTESIPTLRENTSIYDQKKTLNDNSKMILNYWGSFRNNVNQNDSTYPLNNILNRQRTINRSFRTAVDKSFDVPSSEASHINFGMHTERMNHLRMSSQSDDLRKNKKSKKGIIETFQNFFKSNKKLNQDQKYPVELLNYNKNEDVFQ